MRQLPVVKAFGHILDSTRHNLRFAFHSQWPWLVVMAALIVGLYVTMGDHFALDEQQMKAAVEKDPSIGGKFLFWVLTIITVGFLAFASVAVSWHRYVLTDELPQGWQRLRVDAVVLRYLGNLLLISLLASLVAIPVMMVAGIFVGILGTWGFPIAVLLAVFVLMPVIYRLSVKLPAVALGRRDFSLGEAWRRTDGNWWQIMGLGLLVTAITWGVGLLLMGVTLVLQQMLPPDIAGYADLVVQLGVNWVLTILGITMLTSLYGFFVESRDF